jgi:hypothetical protein
MYKIQEANSLKRDRISSNLTISGISRCLVFLKKDHPIQKMDLSRSSDEMTRGTHWTEPTTGTGINYRPRRKQIRENQNIRRIRKLLKSDY